jgi:hypothetical protein
MDLSTADVFNRTAVAPVGLAPGQMNQTNAHNFGRSKWSHLNSPYGGGPNAAVMALGSRGSSPGLQDTMQATVH